MAKRNTSKHNKKTLAIVAVLLIIFLVALIVVLYKTNKLETVITEIKIDLNKDTSNNTNDESSSIPGDSLGALNGEIIKVHFIFVGQGDAILLELPGNKYMLVDAGSGLSASKENKEHYYSYLENTIEGNVIDYLVVTHPDSDHVNMMSQVVDDYEIKNFYYNYYSDCSKTYKTFTEKAKNEVGASSHIIDNENSSTFYLSVGECDFTFFSPGNDGFGSSDSTIKNGMSIMMLVEYGGRKMLLTGDAPSEQEEWFILYTETLDMDVDFLKVAHHGSQHSSTTEFLNYVDAEYAIICVDANANKYGHPTEEALTRIESSNAQIYRTDINGNIVLSIDLDGDYAFSFLNE